MFIAALKEASCWAPILALPALGKSLEWINRYAMISNYGDYELGGPGWYANVHSYQTMPEVECLWENHRHTVDIQYIISGRERILWASVDEVGTAQRYLADKDREEFSMHSGEASSLVMLPDMFAVFLPGDAHCPKVAVDEPEVVKKVVVKIPVILLNNMAL